MAIGDLTIDIVDLVLEYLASDLVALAALFLDNRAALDQKCLDGFAHEDSLVDPWNDAR